MTGLIEDEDSQILVISWKGASYLKLQVFNSDEGTWEDIEFTDGKDSMALAIEEFGSSGMFRIIESTEDDE